MTARTPGGEEADSGDPRAAARLNGAAVVVGGGLAGIAAALLLAESGRRVTLVEARPRLGGLAFSFRRGGLWVDNGQHVFLRCCTAYRGFLERIDARDLVILQDRLEVPVLDGAGASLSKASDAPGHGRFGRLRRSRLPAPLHLAASLARYPHLKPWDRLSVGRAAWALRGLDPADPALDRQDFATWLIEHGQSPRAIEALWDLVGVATLNARADEVSLALAAMVFKTGLLSRSDAGDIGWARVPLGEIHHTRARAALEQAGATVLLRSRVMEIVASEEGAGYTVTLRGGPEGSERLRADQVVLAVPPTQAHQLLPKGALEAPDRLLRIGTTPILNAHVVYDRRVLGKPFLAALDSPVQWIFDRTHASGLTGGGQYLAVSQSAVYDEIDLPTAELGARYLPELERLLPSARHARVLDFFVTRERTATFRPVPGVGALRPEPRTGVPGVYLAGAWTATGWPATMEGAVRSGLRAAREALLTGPGSPPDPRAGRLGGRYKLRGRWGDQYTRLRATGDRRGGGHGGTAAAVLPDRRTSPAGDGGTNTGGEA